MLCEQLHSPQWKRIHLHGVCYLVRLFTMKFNSEKGNEAVSFVCAGVIFSFLLLNLWWSFLFFHTDSWMSADRSWVFSLTTPRLQVCEASLTVTQEVFCRMRRWQPCEFLHPEAAAVKIWTTSLRRSQVSSSHFPQLIFVTQQTQQRDVTVPPKDSSIWRELFPFSSLYSFKNVLGCLCFFYSHTTGGRLGLI